MRRHPKAAAVGSTLGTSGSRVSSRLGAIAFAAMLVFVLVVAPAAHSATRAELPGLSKLGAAGTGDTTINSKTVALTSTTAGTFEKGQYIAGEGISEGTTIVDVGPGTIEISANATTTKSGVSLTASNSINACGAATDAEGNYYLGSAGGFSANITSIKIYKSDGTFLNEIAMSGFNKTPCNLAVDSLGRIYGTKLPGFPGETGPVIRYKPSPAPPITGTTTYTLDTSLGAGGELVTGGASSVAVNPANDRAYVTQAPQNEVQKVTKTGVPTEGTFKLSLTTAKGSGTTTSGSNVITGVSSIYGASTSPFPFHVRDEITGAGIPPATTITAINAGEGKLTLSANATASGSVSNLVATETTAGAATGTVSTSSKIITGVLVQSGNLVIGESLQGTGLPADAFISAISGNCETGCSVTYTGATNPTVGGSGVALTAPGIRWNATGPNLQNGLRGLPGVGGTGLTVSGPVPYVITFGAPFAGANVDQLACDGSTLVPPGCSVETSVAGNPASRVSIYEPNGTLVSDTIGASVAGATYYGVDVYGANGRVYTVDSAHNKAYIFSPAGALLKEIDGSESPAAFAQMEKATVAVDQSNGNVLVSDVKAHQAVDEFNAAGKYVTRLTHTPSLAEGGPTDIAVDGSATANRGNVYVSSGELNDGKLYAYAPLSPTKTLTTSVPGGSGSVKCNGTTCASSYAEESSISLEAIPAVGFKLKEWKSGTGSATSCNTSSASTCTITLNENSSVQAEFQLAGFKLQVTKPGPGAGKVTSTPSGIDCGIDCDETFSEGALVSLSASPDPGSIFKSWGGDCSGSGACEVTMSAAKNVSATFVAAPSVTTAPGATNIVPKKADVAGTVNPNGTQITASSCKVEYGETTGYGSTAPCVPADPGAGSSPIAVSASLSGLKPATTYHFRFTAANEGGTTSGSDQEFTTAALLAPMVETKAATSVGKVVATLNGSVNPKLENVTDCKFEYGTSAPAYGQTVNCVPASPGAGNSAVDVSASIGSLAADTTYHFRLVATNGGGTTNGSDLTFKTAANEIPAISSLAPTTGPAAGGTQVTITGINFIGATAVKFGATNATTFTVESATQVKATAPAGTGVADVSVTTPEGTSANTGQDDYTYVVAPAISSLSSTAGPTAGGTVVTITGTNLTGATAVKFGATNASAFTVESATQIKATAPAGTGTVDVTVTTVGGTSANTGQDDYTYVAAPTVSSLSPTTGPPVGGTVVTITGTNLTGATAVKFGSSDASAFTVESATQIKATAPAGTGVVDVTVTTVGGTSSTGGSTKYSYGLPPTTGPCAPSAGPIAGGTVVTITGTNLTGATAVKFGSSDASAFTVESATQIKATAPAGSAGAVEITVTTPNGTSSTGTCPFTYAVAPAVSGVSPGQGSVVGGTVVTITGTNLTGATAVKFGSSDASAFTVESATQVKATAPAGSSGTVDVTVTTPGGTSATGASDKFTYVPLPAVIKVAPAQGPLAGGSVTISGTNLTGATAVKFGSSDAIAFTVNGANQITATAPPGSAGTVDVTVTTVGGASATSASSKYTYVAAPTVISGVGATEVGQGTAKVAASVNPNSANVSACKVEYGATASYGFEKACVALPGSGSSLIGISASLAGLSANTTYHFRFVVTNVGGTTRGDDQSFSTLADTCETNSSLCPPPVAPLPAPSTPSPAPAPTPKPLKCKKGFKKKTVKGKARCVKVKRKASKGRRGR